MISEGTTENDFAESRSFVNGLASRNYADLQLTYETLVSTHFAMVP
jgi:hypothetical protein